MSGYIYIREHESYSIYDACKLGKTENIPDRDVQYSTGEINRGIFSLVIELDIRFISTIERLLQNEFRDKNIYKNAGIEFYNKCIINLIEPCLIKYGICYRKLSNDDIHNLIRKNRIREIIKKINVPILVNKLKKYKEENYYVPRIDQQIIIKKSIEYFGTRDKGILVLMCGVGKTIISLLISKALSCNKILIGVPNKLLLFQWETVIVNVFKNVPSLVVYSKKTTAEVREFLSSNFNNCIIITTYASVNKVAEACSSLLFKFDIKINDEAHHLTSANVIDKTRKYIEILDIPSVKQLSLTATLKQIENSDLEIISNDTIEYFGEVIDRKSLLWSINENIICDYVIQTFIIDDEDFSSLGINKTKDKRLLLSAYIALKSIFDKHSHHLLIYTNNRDNSMRLAGHIKLLMKNRFFKIDDLYYSEYHSGINSKTQTKIIDNFKNHTYGIIVCVYCLSEGWDFPLLDAVVFAENMTSNIRIVQSTLRASRKNINEPEKITKIILPVLNKYDWLEENENKDFKKIKEVIYQIGLEDESIMEKIKVYNVKITKHSKKVLVENLLESYNDDMTSKLRLKTIKRSSLLTPYGKAKKILENKNILSKKAYLLTCNKDIRLSIEPELAYGDKFVNWVDYLNIKRLYYEIDDCKRMISGYLATHLDFKKYHLNLKILCKKLCKLDKGFPPCDFWTDYYSVVNLNNIITIPANIKKSNVINFF